MLLKKTKLGKKVLMAISALALALAVLFGGANFGQTFHAGSAVTVVAEGGATDGPPGSP